MLNCPSLTIKQSQKLHICHRPPEDLRKQWPASLSKLSRRDRHACVRTAQFSRVPFLWKIKSNVLAVISFSSYHAHTKAEVPFEKKKLTPPPSHCLPGATVFEGVIHRERRNHKTKSPQFAGSVVRRGGIIDWNGRKFAKSSFKATKYIHLDPVTIGVFILFCFYFTVKGITEQTHQAEDGARTSVWEARGIS